MKNKTPFIASKTTKIYSLFIGFIMLFSGFELQAQNPSTLSIQGVVRNSNGSAVEDGDQNLTFRLYADETGGTELWTEMQTLNVTSGVFSAELGSVTDLDIAFDQPYYLGVELEGSTEMTPRSLLTAAPYAFSLIGVDNKFPNTGNVGIGTTDPEWPLHIVGSMKLEGADFNLVDSTRGNGGRALVHDTDNRLAINFGTDFDGGVRIFGKTLIPDELGLGSATDPVSKLHIRGGSIANLTEHGYITLGNTPTKSMAIDYQNIQVRDGANTGKLFLQQYGGNVGVGSGTADTKLQVTSGDDASLTGNGYFILGLAAGENIVMDNNEIIARNNGTASDLLLQKDGGGVAIGIGSASNALVHINGGKTNSYNGFGWLSETTQDFSTGSTGNHSYSLHASARIAAQEFNAWSDARIKNIQGVSAGETDLATLCQIEITDYLFKDIEGRGSVPQKKVIGQQVAKVFPQAVSTHTKDFVPDILHNSLVENGWVKVPGHSVKAGDRIRLIFKEGMEDVEVVSVSREAIQTTCERNEKVIVFGKEVHDFHVVDYTAISMLNVSATQELARQNEFLQKKVAVLQAENQAFKAEIDELKTQTFTPKEMAALRGMLSQ